MSMQEILDYESTERGRTRVLESWTGPTATPARLAYRGRLVCWILRILCGSGGMPVYCEPGNPRLGVLADLLNVPLLADPAARVQDVQQALHAAFEAAESRSQDQSACLPVEDCAMLHTVQWLAASADLDVIESEIFEFAAAMRAFRPLRVAVGTWGEIGLGELPQAFSGILNRSLQDVTPALQRDSRLLRCGLLSVSPHGDNTLGRLLKVPRVLGQRIPVHEGHPSLMLSHLVVPLVPPTLGTQDFQHMQKDTQLARAWLAGALQPAASRGTHLLVSGSPGLGKTEWVRAVLTEFSATTTVNAMELVVLDEEGTALSGEDRLSHLRLTLNMLRNTAGGVIVFDEADDVFRAGGDATTSGGDPAAVTMANHRASLNRLIEDSRIPVIWIMNHPDILDPAVLRRFDAVITFECMPRSVRLAMLQQRLGQVAGAVELARWADVATLTPALIDRLAVVVERAKAVGQPMDWEHCRHWLCSRLPGKHTSRLKRSATKSSWDAQFVQASEDLLAIAAGMGRCGSARVLLYGEPGTGKTAYAHSLAKLLDKPLLEKRASDLLSPWVGETEQRISQAFESAVSNDAVLFIDEADSLLASREHAVRNWEVTQVNELLEQLSDFDGIVVLATNRLDALDAAVLRRMDAKIRFDPLNQEQLRMGFISLCEGIDVVPGDQQLAAVSQLKGLTPGDFACVRRRLAFAPIASPEDMNRGDSLLILLGEELRLKNKGSLPIGFYQSQDEACDPSNVAALI